MYERKRLAQTRVFQFFAQVQICKSTWLLGHPATPPAGVTFRPLMTIQWLYVKTGFATFPGETTLTWPSLTRLPYTAATANERGLASRLSNSACSWATVVKAVWCTPAVEGAKATPAAGPPCL